MTTKTAAIKDRFKYTSGVRQTPAGSIAFFEVTDPVTGEGVGIRADSKRRILDEHGEVVRHWTGLPIRTPRSDKRIFRDLTSRLEFLIHTQPARVNPAEVGDRRCRAWNGPLDL